MTRRSLLLSAVSLPIVGKQWDESKFPDWSTSTIDRLLSDSPWAKEWEATIEVPVERNAVSTFAQLGMDLPRLPRVPQPSPAPGPTQRIPTIPSDGPWSVRTHVSVIVRWASARPVRRATALQQFGRNGLSDERAVELLKSTPEEYVVELAGLPRNAAGRGPEEIQKQLTKSAKLFVAGRRPLSPSKVSVPTYGLQVTASLRFPRYSNLTAEEGNIEVSAEAGQVRLSERFKLRSMIYEGELAL